MNHKRILAVHDVSCVGRCSLTVALPIISAAGIECSGLPTAVLSTHTGGFQGFTYHDLTEDMVPIDEHWCSLDLKFDAFYTGFLGSFEQIDMVCRMIDDLSHEGTTVYVDPVMADKGKLYSVFGPDFPKGMRRLCEKADVIVPNLTELCMMLDMEWCDGPYTREYIDSMLERGREFGVDRMVLTGVSFEQGVVGAVYIDYTTGETGEVMRSEVPGYYHGTGDVFGSALVGACERGLPLSKAVEAAVDLTVDSIEDTYSSGDDVRYGVNFERHLPDYIRAIGSGSDEVTVTPSTDENDLRVISSIAHSVWHRTYDFLETEGQVSYMLERFQTYEAIREQIDQGYTYLVIRRGPHIIGFCGYITGSDGLFLSKAYILPEHQGKGYFSKALEVLMAKARGLENPRIHLTVNRMNTAAIDVYRHMGFEIYGSGVKEIGDGYVMDDYYLELRL